MNILAIESSCDETAAAIVKDGREIISSTIASSAVFHKQFGGVLPELASRKQLEYIFPVLHDTLKPLQLHTSEKAHPYELIRKEIDAIAVTVGPGLIGSLLVGVETAKTLAYITNKPCIPVNHVPAHIYANLLNTSQDDKELITYPAIALVVSGGHTELFLMENEHQLQWLSGTIDDAAGEAFDKTGRLLGFENRGGAAIEEAATKYPEARDSFQLTLPRPLLHDDTLNFSFSGLKTAVLRIWQKQKELYTEELQYSQFVSAFSYEIQEAISDVLVFKTLRATDQTNAKSILLAGGVAANQRLREKFVTSISAHNPFLSFHAPPVALCTDNAASIASCAYFLNKTADWHTITATPNLSVEI